MLGVGPAGKIQTRRHTRQGKDKEEEKEDEEEENQEEEKVMGYSK